MFRRQCTFTLNELPKPGEYRASLSPGLHSRGASSELNDTVNSPHPTTLSNASVKHLARASLHLRVRVRLHYIPVVPRQGSLRATTTEHLTVNPASLRYRARL
jgi:hypothetical protein